MTTSSQNTGPDIPNQESAAAGAPVAPPPSAQFSGLLGDDKPNATEKDDAKAALEAQLQQERDARNEERFVWIVVCVILVDVLWFHNSANALLPVVILILQLVLLLILAKRMGIEEIVQLVDRVLANVGHASGGNG